MSRGSTSLLFSFFGSTSRPSTSSSAGSVEASPSPSSSSHRDAGRRHLSLPSLPPTAHAHQHHIHDQRTRQASVPNLPPLPPNITTNSPRDSMRFSALLNNATLPNPLRLHLHLPFPFASAPPSPLTMHDVASRVDQPELVPPSPSRRVSVIVEQVVDLNGRSKTGAAGAIASARAAPPVYERDEKERSPPAYEPRPPKTTMRHLFLFGFVFPLLWVLATIKLCIILLAPVPSRSSITSLPPPVTSSSRSAPSSRRPSITSTFSWSTLTSFSSSLTALANSSAHAHAHHSSSSLHRESQTDGSSIADSRSTLDLEDTQARVQDAIALQKEEIRWGWRSFVALVTLLACIGVCAGVYLSWDVLRRPSS